MVCRKAEDELHISGQERPPHPRQIRPPASARLRFIDGSLPREHLLLDEAVMSANISNNTSRTPFTVTNKAKGKTVVRDNLSEG